MALPINVKKVLCCTLALLLLASVVIQFSGCKSDSAVDNADKTSTSSVESNDPINDKTLYNYDEMDLKERSETFADLLLKTYDFTELSQNFPATEEFTDEINAELYEAISNQIIDRFGKLVKATNVTEIPVSEDPNIIGVTVECQCETSSFTLSLSFEEDLLCGFDTYPVIDTTIIEEGIKIKIGKAGEELPGVLLLPDDYEDNKLVVIIPGSGPQDLNGTNVYLKPYRDLAKGLYDNNLAVYRFDKRTHYYNDSIDSEALTPKTEIIDDVLDIIKYFTSNNEYNFEKIYLMGHSLGGYLMPKIYEEAKAAELDKYITGMVYLAANASPIEDCIVDQYRTYISDFSNTDTSQEEAILNSMIEARDRIKSLNETSEYIPSQLMGASVKYYLYLQNYDPVAAASNINIPMLFVFAENDKNVPLSEKEKWQLGLSQKDNTEFVVFKDLNHLFTKGAGWLQLDCFSKSHVEDEVIEAICSWKYMKGDIS